MIRLVLFVTLTAACSHHSSVASDHLTTLTRTFPSDTQPALELGGCIFASPIEYISSGGEPLVLVADGSGKVAAISDTGQLAWSLDLPAPDNEHSFVVATPKLLGQKLVVAYHTTPVKTGGPNLVDPRI